ncbi:hypothetical protein [Nodosilinea nodulosa]|uniref:hypothetical protein n=1 Tax=Nodosilinea nodulosa TaxID=416001 RepID=UPI0003071987|nr:hypothetical protein [Nodosilinea nodulosa]
MIRRLFALVVIAGLMGLPIVITLSGLLPVIPPAIADVQTDTSTITTAVVQALTFPGQPKDANPRVSHVAVVGNYALVDWLLGDGGGEMLLTRQDNAWQVVGGGGGAMDSRTLIELGVPEVTAVQLVQQLQAQWGQKQ